MAHQKLKLEFIENRRRRMVTYRKRKETLKKAAYELSTLCGVPTAIICFSPDGKPETWPEDEGAVRDIVGRHRSAEKRSKHHFDFPGYLAAQFRKALCGQEWDAPPLDGIPEESLREMASSLDAGLEIVRRKIDLLKEDSRCNQGDFHGDTGREQQQQQGFPCNNPAFMGECSNVPVVSKAAVDDGPGQGHGAFVPMEPRVAANAYLPCSSTASRDFNYEQTAPAFSMPLLFMPTLSTGATSEHSIASGSDRPFIPQENQFVKKNGDEGNANAQ